MTKAKYNQIKKLFSQFTIQKFAKNSLIFKPGDKIDSVYFMKSGFVRVFIKTPKGENTLNIFKPLFLISVAHHFSRTKNQLFFQAITPIEVYTIPRKEFNRFLSENPEIAQSVMDFFFSNLMVYFNNQGQIINGNAINKVASVLLQLVQDYGDSKQDRVVVNFPATHRIIANLVGLTRETTSVQMSKLQKQGIISAKRTQFVVNDLNRLKYLADNTD